MTPSNGGAPVSLRIAVNRPIIERRQADYMARHEAKQRGAEERKAAAEAKRSRKNAKRAGSL